MNGVRLSEPQQGISIRKMVLTDGQTVVDKVLKNNFNYLETVVEVRKIIIPQNDRFLISDKEGKCCSVLPFFNDFCFLTLF